MLWLKERIFDRMCKKKCDYRVLHMMSEILTEWLKSVLLTCAKKQKKGIVCLTQAFKLHIASAVLEVLLYSTNVT